MSLKTDNYEEYKKLKDELYDGKIDREFVQLHIQEWIDNGNADVIDCVSHGCLLTKDAYLLSVMASKLLGVITIGDICKSNDKYINIKTMEELEKQMDELGTSILDSSFEELVEYANKVVIERCKDALYVIIKYLQKLDNEASRHNLILDEAAKCKNRDVRLFCAYSIDDYLKLYEQGDERIKKVIMYRELFRYRWENEYTENQKDFVDILVNEIGARRLKMEVFPMIVDYPEGYVNGHYSGPVFKEGKTKNLKLDEDLWLIGDKHVLCSELIELAKQGIVIFNDELQKQFNELFGNSGLKRSLQQM